MISYRNGALAIIEDAQPEGTVLRALKQIDGRLFLERQLSLEGQAVWCVVCDVGSEYPPLTIIEWRDSDEHPIHELTWGIVERVQRMERDGGKLAARVIKANSDLIEARKLRTQEHWSDLGTEFEKRMSPGYSAVLHRGQSLRMARDRRRARGERI